VRKLEIRKFPTDIILAEYWISRSDGTAMSLQAQAPIQRPARYTPQETVKVSFYAASSVSATREIKDEVNAAYYIYRVI